MDFSSECSCRCQSPQPQHLDNREREQVHELVEEATFSVLGELVVVIPVVPWKMSLRCDPIHAACKGDAHCPIRQRLALSSAGHHTFGSNPQKHSSFLWMQPARFACDLAQHIEATDTITKKTILAKASCAISTWTMLKYVGIGVKNARANVIKFSAIGYHCRSSHHVEKTARHLKE